jgi:hypothetical protein
VEKQDQGGATNNSPTPIHDNTGLPEPLKRVKELMEKYKVGTIAEGAGTATDWASKGAAVGGLTKAAEVLEKLGKGLTIINALDHFLNKDYFGLGKDLLSMTKASPWIFAGETVGSIMTSQFTENQAAVDADQISHNYMIMAHNALVNGDQQLANEYWSEAARYEKLRNIDVSHANKKE